MIRCIKVSVNTSEIQNKTYKGKQYIVAPAVIIKEGILNGYYVSANAIKESLMHWKHAPLVIDHAYDQQGNPVAFRDNLDLLENQEVGFVSAPEILNENSIRAEFWVDVAACEKCAPGLIDRITAGETIDVSAGYFAEEKHMPGTWNGTTYQKADRILAADHVAILPSTDGACSVADGCGWPRTNESLFKTLTDKVTNYLERKSQMKEAKEFHAFLTPHLETLKIDADELKEITCVKALEAMKNLVELKVQKKEQEPEPEIKANEFEAKIVAGMFGVEVSDLPEIGKVVKAMQAEKDTERAGLIKLLVDDRKLISKEAAEVMGTVALRELSQKMDEKSGLFVGRAFAGKSSLGDNGKYIQPVKTYEVKGDK